MIQQPRQRPFAADPPAIALLTVALLAGVACSGGPAPARALPPLVVSDRGGALRIYEVDRDLGVATLVGSARADEPAWRDTMPARLPDGRVVFVSDRGGRPALHVTGPGPTAAAIAIPLAAPPAPDAPAPGPGANAAGPADSDPAPFGPGRIVFARAATDGAPRELQVVNVDGSDLRALTRHPADNGAPCALADGRTIVFVSDRDGAPRLYRLDGDAPDPETTVTPLLADATATDATATGAGAAALLGAGPGFADSAPACLADGSIVFARAVGGRPAQLFAVVPGGAHPAPRQITDATILPSGAGEPVGLDDGTILLTAGPASGGANGRGPRYGVYRISRGGYNLARVTRDGAGYDDLARGLNLRR
jgi:hypothetical protein